MTDPTTWTGQCLDLPHLPEISHIHLDRKLTPDTDEFAVTFSLSSKNGLTIRGPSSSWMSWLPVFEMLVRIARRGSVSYLPGSVGQPDEHNSL